MKKIYNKRLHFSCCSIPNFKKGNTASPPKETQKLKTSNTLINISTMKNSDNKIIFASWFFFEPLNRYQLLFF